MELEHALLAERTSLSGTRTQPRPEDRASVNLGVMTRRTIPSVVVEGEGRALPSHQASVAASGMVDLGMEDSAEVEEEITTTLEAVVETIKEASAVAEEGLEVEGVDLEAEGVCSLP